MVNYNKSQITILAQTVSYSENFQTKVVKLKGIFYLYLEYFTVYKNDKTWEGIIIVL